MIVSTRISKSFESLISLNEYNSVEERRPFYKKLVVLNFKQEEFLFEK